jgi:hypothetical protein
LDDKDVGDGTFQLIPQDEEERHLQLVELNVIEQCLNLYKTGAVCEQAGVLGVMT